MSTASWSQLASLPSQTIAGPNFGSAAITGGSITLATAGGTPTALNYYEEFSTTITWTGACISGSTTTTMDLTRIGRSVFMTIGTLSATGTGNASTIVSSGAIPSRFRPATNLVAAAVNVLYTTNAGLGVLNVTSSNGNLTVGLTNTAAQAFGTIPSTLSVNQGFNTFTACWT